MRNLWKSAHIVRLGSLCYKLSKILICNYFPNSTETGEIRQKWNEYKGKYSCYKRPNRKQGRCSRAEMQNDQGKKRVTFQIYSVRHCLFLKRSQLDVVYYTAVSQCRHATLLPTILSSRLWGGALRDNTKNGCVADWVGLAPLQTSFGVRLSRIYFSPRKNFLRGGEMNTWLTNPKGRLRGGWMVINKIESLEMRDHWDVTEIYSWKC